VFLKGCLKAGYQLVKLLHGQTGHTPI
jgi:hypothetical protein